MCYFYCLDICNFFEHASRSTKKHFWTNASLQPGRGNVEIKQGGLHYVSSYY